MKRLLEILEVIMDAPILQPFIWGGWLILLFYFGRWLYKACTCEG